MGFSETLKAQIKSKDYGNNAAPRKVLVFI